MLIEGISEGAFVFQQGRRAAPDQIDIGLCKAHKVHHLLDKSGHICARGNIRLVAHHHSFVMAGIDKQKSIRTHRRHSLLTIPPHRFSSLGAIYEHVKKRSNVSRLSPFPTTSAPEHFPLTEHTRYGRRQALATRHRDRNDQLGIEEANP
jgi:hypothetical protein